MSSVFNNQPRQLKFITWCYSRGLAKLRVGWSNHHSFLLLFSRITTFDTMKQIREITKLQGDYRWQAGLRRLFVVGHMYRLQVIGRSNYSPCVADTGNKKPLQWLLVMAKLSYSWFLLSSRMLRRGWCTICIPRRRFYLHHAVAGCRAPFCWRMMQLLPRWDDVSTRYILPNCMTPLHQCSI